MKLLVIVSYQIRLLYIVSVILLCFSILYLSFISDPQLLHVMWLPKFLSAWADRHDQLRTAVPFVGLGGLIGLAVFPTARLWRKFLVVWVVLSGLSLFVELGQLFLPRRVFDLLDVFWGSMGSAAGILAGFLCRLLASKASAVLRRK